MSDQAASPEQLALDLVLDSPLVGKAKNERTLMVFNFFSLTRDKVTELPAYDDGRVRIEVIGTRHGVANIWDKELIIYAASLIREKMNRGEPPSPHVTFTAHDFFRITGTKPAGTAYDRIEESLTRLKGTLVKTNALDDEDENGDQSGTTKGFGWIDDFDIKWRRGKGGTKTMRAVEVTLGKRLFDTIVKHNRMLTYDSKYFDLPPTEKRLYEIARAHCGNQNGFKINIEKLQRRVGGTQDLRFFKRDLIAISKRKNPLPEYGFIVVDPRAPRQFDSKAPKPPGRTPLKSYMVMFYRLDRLSQMPTFEQAPLIDEGTEAFPESEL